MYMYIQEYLYMVEPLYSGHHWTSQSVLIKMCPYVRRVQSFMRDCTVHVYLYLHLNNLCTTHTYTYMYIHCTVGDV